MFCTLFARRWIAGFCLAVGTACLTIGSAAAQDDPARIQEHLEAGEFGPAKVLARRAPDAAQRDALMRDIMRMQALTGARGGAARTAGGIANDLSRSQGLHGMGGGSGGFGGAAAADFTELIDLITTTVKPESWTDNGGDGTIKEFFGGVYVDTSGVMKRLDFSETSSLASRRNAAAKATLNRDVTRKSELRKVSLSRLEKMLQMQWALGREPDEAMKALAGLRRVKYVFVYPETGDIVIAGPAGDWNVNEEGRRTSLDNGQPVLNLDDFVVMLKNAYEQNGKFGCSINPTQDGLARAQAFQKENVDPFRRPDEWLAGLRKSLGKQDIVVYGIDPRTATARTIVEADYRMKLVGMGIEDGTLGVKSYLDAIQPGAAATSAVVRWWFTLNYGAIQANHELNSFEIVGQGVKVLSENEFVSERGERKATGKSDEEARQFAEGFTRQFEGLASKYPVYGDLRNIFDLALVAGLVRSHDLAEQTGWHMTHFLGKQGYQLELGPAPKFVDSVANFRLDRQNKKKHFVAGVSGGVTVETNKLVQPTSLRVDDYGVMSAERAGSDPTRKNLAEDAWWWD